MPSLRTHGFFPHWFQREVVADFALTPADQAVFYAVCGQLDNRGTAKASQRLLMERTNLSRSTVQAALGRLLKFRILEQTWPSGAKSAAQYAIPEYPPAPPSTIPAPVVRDEAQIRQRRQA